MTNKTVQRLVNFFIGVNDSTVKEPVLMHTGNARKKLKDDIIVAEDSCVTWIYHGSEIAKYLHDGPTELVLNLCGFPTQSTMVRLNALLERMGIKARFSGYGTRAYEAKPKFNGDSIDSDQPIEIRRS